MMPPAIAWPEHRDGWLGEAKECEEAVPESGEGICGAAGRDSGGKVDTAAEVEAGTKEAAFAGQDDCPDALFLAGGVKRLGEIV